MKKSSLITWIVCVPTTVRNCSSLYAAALMVYRSLYTVDIDLAPPLWCHPAPSPPLWWSYPAHDSLIISIRFTFSSILVELPEISAIHWVTSSPCTLRKFLADFAVYTLYSNWWGLLQSSICDVKFSQIEENGRTFRRIEVSSSIIS